MSNKNGLAIFQNSILQTQMSGKEYSNSLCYNIMRDAKIQTFQYRILNNILYKKRLINKIKIQTSDTLNYCGGTDNILHLLSSVVMY